MSEVIPVPELFYLQDSRSYVGNDMVWWTKGGGGYSTDLRKAEVYTKEKAIEMHKDRPTDIPWPVSYIDARIRPAVDMQYCDKKEALKGTGVKIIKPKPPRKEVWHCTGCGRFISVMQAYSQNCPHCGANNSP